MKRKSEASLQGECDAWNLDHPVGTVVKYHHIIGKPEFTEHETRSKAFVLSEHTPVVFLKGFSGCVCLEAIEAK